VGIHFELLILLYLVLVLVLVLHLLHGARKIPGRKALNDGRMFEEMIRVYVEVLKVGVYLTLYMLLLKKKARMRWLYLMNCFRPLDLCISSRCP
jgi:hypothetical protein